MMPISSGSSKAFIRSGYQQWAVQYQGMRIGEKVVAGGLVAGQALSEKFEKKVVSWRLRVKLTGFLLIISIAYNACQAKVSF